MLNSQSEVSQSVRQSVSSSVRQSVFAEDVRTSSRVSFRSELSRLDVCGSMDDFEASKVCQKLHFRCVPQTVDDDDDDGDADADDDNDDDVDGPAHEFVLACLPS